MSDDFDRLLRDTLETQAQAYEPRGDGLTVIRERIAARHARRRWLVPSLALAAVAAAVAGVLVLPQVLPQRDRSHPPTANGASPSSIGPTAGRGQSQRATAPPASRPAGTSPRPPAGLPNLATVWPYPTRDEAAVNEPGDVASGRLPYLRDPKQTALHFVRDFVGVREPVQVMGTHALEAGIGVTVGRANPNNTLVPVTTVYLVRALRGDTSPYVVVRADAPGLQVTDTSSAPGTVRVTGRVAGFDEAVRVSLVGTTGAAIATGSSGSVGRDQPWTVVLPVPAAAAPYAVVAQTASAADGLIAELVVLRDVG